MTRLGLGGGGLRAILGRHLTDAKGRLKHQILKHGQNGQLGDALGVRMG